MTEFDAANTWVMSLQGALPEAIQAELRSIVARRSAPPPTGDQMKVLIFHHVRGLARAAGLSDDPVVIADAIREGRLRLET